MQVNQEVLEGLTKTYGTVFNQSFTNTESYHQKVAMTVPSNTKEQDYPWLGDVPGLREWIGDKVINHLTKHNYTISNKDYEVTIGVKRNDIEDEQTGIYRPLFENMGQEAKRWPDKLIFSLMESGFSETCYDGQYFFDAEHPVGTNTVSNMQAGEETAWYLLDTSRAIKPFIFQERKKPVMVSLTEQTLPNVFCSGEFQYGVECRGNAGFGLWQLAFASKAELNSENFKALRLAMSSQRSETNTPLAVKPSLLVVPPALQDAAEQLIMQQSIAGTANTLYKSIELLVVPYLG